MRPLGTITVLGSAPCDGQQCVTINVNCPSINQVSEATIKIGEPLTTTISGDIVLFSGWIGDYLWEQGSVNGPAIIHDLRNAGYRTLQVDWLSNWFKANSGEPHGIARQACKPATILQWVYDQYHVVANPTAAFCASGHSNGASQLGLSIAQYGLSDLFDAILFESGPNWTRTDHACLLNPAYPELYQTPASHGIIDWGFGQLNNGSGYCGQELESERWRFEETSLVQEPTWNYVSADYIYPETNVTFLMGELDPTSTRAHGEYFYNWLLAAGTPQVNMTIVPGAHHFVTSTASGAEAFRNTLINICTTP